MTTRDHILAIDNGTQSVRALIFDPRGNLIARHKVDLDPYYSVHPGWAEQDPEYYWRSLAEACRGLWAQGVDRETLAGVALTTMRATMVCVGEDGEPLRPAIVWLDQRRTEGVPPVAGVWGLSFRALGLSETIANFQANAESIWLARHQPEIWARTHKFLFLSGFLTHRLTGRFADSVASQVGYVPFDYKRHRWAGARDWKWRAVGIDPRRLPELVRPGEILGEISAKAAEATGIPQGLSLVASGLPAACSRRLGTRSGHGCGGRSRDPFRFRHSGEGNDPGEGHFRPRSDDQSHLRPALSRGLSEDVPAPAAAL